MQISDGGMAVNMNSQHHMEHFDNILNLNLSNEYHYGMEYWNGSYKNGSTPMKEMEGEQRLKSNQNSARRNNSRHLKTFSLRFALLYF